MTDEEFLARRTAAILAIVNALDGLTCGECAWILETVQGAVAEAGRNAVFDASRVQ